MNRTPNQILATLDSARAVAEELTVRLSTKSDVMDLGDLSHIQTTIKKIEALLSEAAEHEQTLRNRLSRTAGRIANVSGVDAFDAPQRQLGFLKDKVNVDADFDAPLPDELLNDFDGSRPAS